MVGIAERKDGGDVASGVGKSRLYLTEASVLRTDGGVKHSVTGHHREVINAISVNVGELNVLVRCAAVERHLHDLRMIDIHLAVRANGPAVQQFGVEVCSQNRRCLLE